VVTAISITTAYRMEHIMAMIQAKKLQPVSDSNLLIGRKKKRDFSENWFY
jgi:hypothetical protein